MKLSLKKKLDKYSILSMMQCYEDSSFYDEYSSIYDELITNRILDNVLGLYKREDNIDNNTVYNEIIYCIVTLSEEFDNAVNKYFYKNDFIRGMLLSTIGDYILFEGSKELYDAVKEDCKKSGINLSPRFEPGAKGVEMSKQKLILEKIKEEHEVSIGITSGYMFTPQKTLGFYYEASNEFDESKIDHDCSSCGMHDCQYRKAILKVQDKRIQVPKGTNLLEALRDNDVTIPAYCSGNGSCGKCKVRQIGGEKLFIGAQEKKYLSDQELEDGIILACYHKIIKDIEIELLDKDEKVEILSEVKELNIIDSRYKMIELQTIDFNDVNNLSMVQRINAVVDKEYNWEIKAIRGLSFIKNFSKLYIITRDEKRIVYVGEREATLYGFALDIGTTTIVLSLVDLLKKKIVGTYKAKNPQGIYGSDVISRINYDISDKDHKQGQAVRKVIQAGMNQLAELNQISKEHIVELVIGANTTMQYLLLGINPHRLAMSPFTCVDTDTRRCTWQEVFFNNAYDIEITIVPSISAYIGGDITSGLLFKNVVNENKTVLFIDIGTNGEMALKNGEDIICVSTAAGPALEGANIECGLSSVNGAINHIAVVDNNIEYEVIGSSAPRGICGTALIDIIAELLKNDRIDTSGKLDTDNVTIYNNDGVNIYLSQRDVRQYQLAKAAIAAGIDIMLKKAEISYEDIDKLYLAGGIANHLNIDNAAKAGLIPPELANKVELIGNSSLSGCINYLLNNDCDEKIAILKSKCKYVELSMDMDFNNAYVDNMMFKL